MKISIITLFPEMFEGPFAHSIVKHAQEKNLVSIEFINIRDFGIGSHKTVDDTPYGGGVGMVMRVDVVHAAIEHAKENFNKQLRSKTSNQLVILMTASGKKYTQVKAKEYASLDHLIIICGHYEGIDGRIKEFIDEEISIGDFVLTGGEIPAMLIADSVTRLVDTVLDKSATENESFSLSDTDTQSVLLEHPHYTRPAEYMGVTVPEVLTSGNHKHIAEHRIEEARNKTATNRPDLLKK